MTMVENEPADAKLVLLSNGAGRSLDVRYRQIGGAA